MKTRQVNGGVGQPLPGEGSEPDPGSGWRRSMDPMERLKVDAARYAGAILYALRAEYQAMADVRAARAVAISRVTRVLRRSSADALLPLVLDNLRERGLVRLDGPLVHFEAPLIEAWEAGLVEPAVEVAG